jgi:hypothetical protein
MYKDFSFLITFNWDPLEKALIGDNILEFIDNKEYENYPDAHPIHKLVERVRNTYEWQITMWWGGLHPFSGEKRTDAAWVAKKAALKIK